MGRELRGAAAVNVVVVATACAGAALDCSLALSGNAIDVRTQDAMAPDATSSDAQVGDGNRSEAGPIDDGADGAGTICVGDGGPNAVRIGTFCIDRTEVTAQHYRRFVDALDAGAAPTRPPGCTWKIGFEAPPPFPDAGPNLPVVNVDWCDAFAFCAWAGKRLCGKVGGGPAALDAVADASADQWFFACSFDGARAYPYGTAYQPTACNGLDFDAGSALPVGSLSNCEGSYPGLFDISGNVLEWEDSCTGTSASDSCRIRGGSYVDFDTRLRCDSDRTAGRAAAFPHLGFRCCSEP